MALWPNNFTDIRGRFPIRLSGSESFNQVSQRVTRSLSFFGNENIAQTSSIPEGAFESRICILAPIVGGGMASTATATLDGDGNMLAGGPMAGTGDITFDGSGVDLSLIISMAGEALVTMTGEAGTLSLTIGMSGQAYFVFTPAASLAMIVPFSGDGSFTLTGIADLKGLLSMSGESSPFTVLSPQSLAEAVWSSVASDSNDTGSMGEKLNDAGSASNPWTEVIESGYTAAEILRLLASVAVGKSAGAGTSEMTFTGLDGTTERVIGTLDGSNNRTAVTVDGA